ncbi:O-antigen ligase family protein [Serratia liquefaciens]|uniref:O-antigen ligase family protein n=1 Tax=Serratia TaxID=613 RepID=UPI00102104F1|nr:O-antigen ligase family protein [Serratia liquefaciens]RYM61941.1 hypothetical protein BSQ98_17220 [Serratia liquefaciens]
MKQNTKKIMVTFTTVCFFIFCFTSIFSLVAARLDNPALKLWKEVLVIIYYLLSVFFILLRGKIKVVNLILGIIIPAFILTTYVISSLGDELALVLYQFKSDFIPFFFVLGLVNVFLSFDDGLELYRKLCKTLIIVGIINIGVIIVQKVFTEWFMVFLQVDEFNNSSRGSGLRLDNVSDNLRAMGTLTSFIGSGTLMVLCFFVTLESGVVSKKIKIILATAFLAGAIATLYKTAIIGIAAYTIIKLFLIFLRVDRKLERVIWGGASVTVFFVSMFVFNSYFVYDQVKNTSLHDSAYSSIFIRVQQHNDIFNDVEKNSLLTGVGIGTNGTEGPSGLKQASKALDSTYVNVLSNYGLLGVIVYLVVYLTIMLNIIAKPGIGTNLALVLLFYHLGIEFFTNNILMNFPLNLFFYIFIYLSLYYKNSQSRESISPSLSEK